jgi:hypothetical protein
MAIVEFLVENGALTGDKMKIKIWIVGYNVYVLLMVLNLEKLIFILFV